MELIKKSNYRYSKTSKKSKRIAKKTSSWGSFNDSYTVPIGEHKLPPLSYDFNALEPYIGAETMKVHYDILHRRCVNMLNKVELELQEARSCNDYKNIQCLESQLALFGSCHNLHTIWWKSITPNKTSIREPLATEINCAFGSMESFKKQFGAVAKSTPGPGWAVLVWLPRAWRVELQQISLHQNNVLQDCIPLLVLDVWEHAYFLDYKSNLNEYVEMWWNIIDWDTANHRLSQAKKVKWKPY